MLGRLVPIDRAVKPREWLVVFRRETSSRLVRFFTFGRYRHVACFGWVPGAKAWIFFEPGLNHIDLRVVPDAEADEAIAAMIDGAMVVRVPAPTEEPGPQMRLALTCTQLVGRIMGLRRCALRPDAFLRDFLANGAEIVSEG